MNIDQSIALVTGANRGIGRALVESLLQRGVRRVYAAGRQLEPLESVAAIDRGRVVPLRMDITNRTEVPAAADRARDVNLLINNRSGFLRQHDREPLRID